ncbi:hypothetical protein [Hyalangium versicolor]|uniref:hypothetical protein n=1 Tax=Hyalangium versicolor TaxID=2861190 RepID=UPI001CCD6015|nr:hypothetical protein [Hyalangium versicolor]
MSRWARHFRQRFHLAHRLSVNARGDEEYSKPEEHPCRYQPSVRLLRAADGSQVVSEAVLFTTVAVSVEDRVWLPGVDPEDEDVGRKPLRAVPHYALSGKVDHYEVHL